MRCPVCDVPARDWNELAQHFASLAAASDGAHVMWLNRNLSRQALSPSVLAARLEEWESLREAQARDVERIEQLVVDQYFRDPPRLIQAFAQGPTPAQARAFVRGWLGFSRRFPRWVGAVISNCPQFDVIAFEVENLMAEVVADPSEGTHHYGLLQRLGRALGMEREELERDRPLPAAEAAFRYWEEMARQPNWVLGFAAVNGIEMLGDRELPRRAGLAQGTGFERASWRALGLPEEALGFIRATEVADVEHGNQAAAILARYGHAEMDEVLETLKTAIGHVRRMFDEMAEAAEEESGVGLA
ncbi:MAG: iron-containing redox enzyme family protein [Firmicutes bacterium]|nr:iron-containing redox enzyme family protein [Bacillota bacterium]